MKAKIFTYVIAMILFAALLASFPPAAQVQVNNLGSAPLKYTVQMLPGPPGLGGPSGAFSINNLGWVAGLSNPPDGSFEHAVLWRGGQPTDLGTLGGFNSNVAFPKKNENGWLVGASETADNDPYQENFCQINCPSPGCLPLNQICRGFLWRSETNKMIALPPLPGGNNSYGFGVNNQRQIVGAAENGVLDPNCIAPQVFDFEGVVWSLDSNGTPFVSRRLAPIAGDAVSLAIQINEDGDIVGASGTCGNIGKHAVLWKKDGSVIDLGSLGGAMNNIAMGLNNQGQVVGTSDLPGDQSAHAFLWEGGTLKDLGALRDGDNANAESINGSGEVVGSSCGPVDCHGFHWQAGVMVDLNSVLPAGSPLLSNAADINSRGEIAFQACVPPDCGPISFVLLAGVLIPDNGALGGVGEAKIIQPNVILPASVRRDAAATIGFRRPQVRPMNMAAR